MKLKITQQTSNCNPINGEKLRSKQIKLHCSNKLIKIPVDKIVRLEGDCNYTVVHTATNKYISSRTLKHYEGILDEEYFVRIHKSHLVNIIHAVGLDLEDSYGSVAFDEGKNIEISRRKVKLVIERFEQYNKA